MNHKMSIDALRAFITNSAEFFGLSINDYLEKAKSNYVIVHDGDALTWDEENLMVLNSVALATEESAGTNDKIVSEYNYYKSKKAI